MKRMFINLLVYLLISSYQLKSQTLYSVDKWMEYIEEMASETEDEERIEALYTDLSYLIEHPFAQYGDGGTIETSPFPI